MRRATISVLSMTAALLVWVSVGAQQQQPPPVPPPPAGGQPPAPAGRGGGRPGGPPAPSVELNRMNHGPFISSTIATEPVTEKAIAVRVNEQASAVMAFDTDLLRVSAAWTGGMLNWFAARDGLQNWPTPGGAIHFATRKGPGWSRTGSFADPRDVPAGPLPKSWGHYKGLYLNGDNVVFSYTIGATQIFDSPGFTTLSERPVFTRTLNLAPATETLSLRVLDLPDEAFLQFERGYVRIRRFGRMDNRFVAARGLPAAAKWAIVDQQLTLQFPATSQPQRVQLLISAVMTPGGGRGGAAVPAAASLTSFMNAFAAAVEASAPVPDLAPLREPGRLALASSGNPGGDRYG